GAWITKRLSADGVRVRVCARHQPVTQAFANTETVITDVRDARSVARALEGCDAAINAVGLYVERGAETFAAIHEDGALHVAQQCAERGIDKLIHLSGIGADETSASSYVRSRARGERLVREALPETTILRPSVLFGPDDRFINTLAKIIRHAPVVPLFGRGLTKLQPVYVDDVASAASGALLDPAAKGKTYELGGASTLTYKTILQLVMARLHKRRLLVPLPFIAWDTIAAISALLPTSPVTRDQIALMKQDNVVSETALSFGDLGIEPAALEDVLPDYAF
ncbi:MAG: complex I NDUFA9 subunit family protein, partial [Pseudomonadota bacterium]